jgi:hypothetical protein
MITGAFERSVSHTSEHSNKYFGTVLQAGRSQIRNPNEVNAFFKFT